MVRGPHKLSTLHEDTEPYMQEANAAMRDPSMSPDDVATLFLTLSRRAVENKLGEDEEPTSTSANDNTPGLGLFLWDLWYLLLYIASEDPSLHERLISILQAVMAKGKGPEGWQIWKQDVDWADLPLFGPTARECHNGPALRDENGRSLHDPYPPEVLATVAGDPPTDSPLSRLVARARTDWLNHNLFIAQLWARDMGDWSTWGIATMRMDLEPYSLPPESRRFTGKPFLSQELDIETAAVWIRIAGKKMYENRQILGPKGNPGWDPKLLGAAGSSGGTWDGVDGYHPDRWAHWKDIFKKISEGEGRQNMIDAAKAAVEAMEQVEREHAAEAH
ncbi:hypothetical protein FKP32DRAFT_1422730 [Trametes sanguinea]|nr:hypothetical protein FKP32DRAFT_1422730 [Trametes sanguinea]